MRLGILQIILTFNRLAPYNLSEKIKIGSNKIFKKISNFFITLRGLSSLFIFYIFISFSPVSQTFIWHLL